MTMQNYMLLAQAVHILNLKSISDLQTAIDSNSTNDKSGGSLNSAERLKLLK
ncbi:hypothetical protein [Candidatus Lokiarchaeum ossiferum]|uniref:hypothetical protein n=1 Tax=Candidatus Lokiarchaeum ossiferum TaxID=2951803 RepID=UPI00352DA11D